jgi:hypothetical protein
VLFGLQTRGNAGTVVDAAEVREQESDVHRILRVGGEREALLGGFPGLGIELQDALSLGDDPVQRGNS